MCIRFLRLIVPGVLILVCAISFINQGLSEDYKTGWTPQVPKTWDDQEMVSLELPLPHPEASPKYITSDYYYRMPVRPVYKSYAVYYPGKQPANYMKWLQEQDPQILFDASKLKTEQDWTNAGELVFDAPIEFVSPDETLFSLVEDPRWYQENHVLVTREGVFPNMRYVIREKGKVELGILACAHCHTRVMPDGTTIKGAQGNFPDDRTFGYETRIEASKSKDKTATLQDLKEFIGRNYAAPWVKDDPAAGANRMTVEQITSMLEAIPPGVCARQGSSIFYPPHIPDLIGLKDRKYFDSSGLVRHRSIVDLMRYAALNQGADNLSEYAGFRPSGELQDPSKESRYSDEQLYALALYVYSLTPPPNPNSWDDLAARGKIVFEQTGCASCHTPPLYTNNQLTPTIGFEIPEDHTKKYDVMNICVDTDPDLTMKTRRGTGYYKVPSLKGVWYRGPFGHNGSVLTLEDWFDPNRVKQDYVPTGFSKPGAKAQPVPGHRFGLDIPPEDRKALIAFLKTL